MDKSEYDCPYPGCLYCVMKETNSTKRRIGIAKFFKDLPIQDNDGQVLPVSGLWNAAMSQPGESEFVELGIFECMTALIWKGLKNRRWLTQDQNIYIPYYAAHIIGSYTMVIEEYAQRAVKAGVVPALIELLKGGLTWVEQRVAVRALGHLATYDSTFPKVASYKNILDSTMQLSMDALDVVYTQFYQYADRRLSYHRDLLTRGVGGLDMEARKAEEWASQLQCWSLQLINCFAFKEQFIPFICKESFISKLSGLWGGLVNENSPAGIGLLRTICHQKSGRLAVADCPGVIESLSNIARSSDDWQYMAVDCLVWLVQDPDTRVKVLDRAVVALADLAEVPSLGEHKKLGDLLMSSLLHNDVSVSSSSLSPTTADLLRDLSALHQRMKWEKNAPKEDIRIKQAAALVVKLEGNARFSSGDIAGASAKYTEALSLCPLRAKKERVTLYSNRAQCHLLLESPANAASDATRALCLHNPINRHAKSLWRRAQAYECLGLVKECLLDAIMFINECSQTPEYSVESKKNKVPNYVERFVKKKMQAAWLFKDVAAMHGGMQYTEDKDDDEQVSKEEDNDGDRDNDDDDDDNGEEASEWETMSETDFSQEGEIESDEVSQWRKQNEDRKADFSKLTSSLKGMTLKELLGQPQADY
ncbi:hypothetical protein O6H91_05G095300 [Diphasiastrum complanatum]|uniref:Uncharacterized protein n=4 Tax=Diphasiastrum complanatum TaxID=34168 RepID=A0ACC2DQZ7_DIPCM|nr:hypothetical protein O6H91_05G095300 [Diphasiastrum complanatum]KAJ7556721.1 hypothetical protein O6H91_05G095300 [Diphasiastrum complanatum]KAJ7556722.1 hypothetical protein O6H91_05G095300 [Diphasiastrum complanatum]KAJ7556723.1 hypothetical protein O6H91_05G095300 [Diphasiastrum complanatum]